VELMIELRQRAELILRLYLEGLRAGFPSPADDCIDERMDLGSLLIKNAAATFVRRVSGDRMRDAGIYDGDLPILGRSLRPHPPRERDAWLSRVATFGASGPRRPRSCEGSQSRPPRNFAIWIRAAPGSS
jgi:hypothetical protein